MRKIFTILIICGCATPAKNQGSFRDKHSWIAGVPGVMHYTKNTAVGVSSDIVDFESYFVTTEKIRTGKSGDSATSIGLGEDSGERMLSKVGWGINVFANYFPSDKNPFFVGLGALGTRMRYAYEEHAVTYSLDESTANVEWIDQSVYALIPIGFSTNYDFGLVNMLAISPKLRVYNHRQMLDDGSDGGVDPDVRAATLDSVDSARKALSFHVIAMTGWAF